MWGYSRQKYARNPRFDSLMAAGLDYLHMKQIERARNYFQRAAAIIPGEPSPWMWLAKTTEDIQQQLAYYEKAAAADPSNTEARASVARCRLQLQGEATLPAYRSGEPLASHDDGSPIDTLGTTFKCKNCGGGLAHWPEYDMMVCTQCDSQFKDDEIIPTCDNCGGTLVHQPEENALVCTRCATQLEIPIETFPADGSKPLEYALVSERGHRWAEAQYRVHCAQCGASSVLPPAHKTATCPYCGSDQVVDTTETEGLIAPDRIILMQVDHDRATEIFTKWLGSGFFTPNDLRKMAKRAALRPGYYPFWMFEATYQVNWTAMQDQSSSDFSVPTPISDTQILFFKEILVPGSRLIRMRDLAAIEPFDIEKAQKFTPEVLANWAAFAYTESVADASLDARAKISTEARRKTETKARAGGSVSDFTMGMGDFSSQRYELLYLPLWVGVYKYRGEEYHVVINGQTGKLGGSKPVDNTKIWLLLATAMVAILLLLLLYLFTNSDLIMNALR